MGNKMSAPKLCEIYFACNDDKSQQGYLKNVFGFLKEEGTKHVFIDIGVEYPTILSYLRYNDIKFIKVAEDAEDLTEESIENAEKFSKKNLLQKLKDKYVEIYDGEKENIEKLDNDKLLALFILSKQILDQLATPDKKSKDVSKSELFLETKKILKNDQEYCRFLTNCVTSLIADDSLLTKLQECGLHEKRRNKYPPHSYYYTSSPSIP